MEKCDEKTMKVIDASVGGLVWVRRRNGSWWPGRIMGLDEVPESSLVSPKAGTPIKLLGRDDASLDWYNLEKSKRVKAFRCGEYDTCIDKAMAAAANLSKKAIKYARREDAIIHALKIENTHLAQNRAELQLRKENSEKVPKRSKGNEIAADVDDDNDGVQGGIEKRRRTPNDSEDDGNEGIKRMRGLEDLGLVIESKGKGQGNDENGVLRDVSLTDAFSSENCSHSLKRKRSQVRICNENSKRKKRSRPLTKVLESTVMVSVPVTCNHLVSSDLSDMESRESIKSSSTAININCNSAGILCENTVLLNALENDSEACHNKAKNGEISSLSVPMDNDSSDRLFDVPLIGEKQYSVFYSAFTSCSPGIDLVHGLTRRCGLNIHADAGTNGLMCMSPTYAQVNGNNINGIEKSPSEWQQKGKRNSRQMSKKQEARRIMEKMEVSRDLMGKFFAFFEVKIEVKGDYKPRNVPLVSLMSKSNGKAIVGHPLTVEMLEETVNLKMLSLKEKKLWIPQWNKSSSLCKKTRRLSALTRHNRSDKEKKKKKKRKRKRKKKKETKEKARETVVACIPLKVVFSRINEAVKGSTRQNHH